MEKYDALGYYEILGVAPDADTALIKRQYYEKAKFWHPDHNENPNAVEFFQKVSVAYEVLNDAKKRAEYDLLSIVYCEKDFPTLGSLKIYKNQSDKTDAALRVLKQRKVKASGSKCEVRETKDICNIKEAGNMVLSTSISNWLCGWWGRGGFNKTINAIKFNMQAAKALDMDNLKLLIHNAVAYEQENNTEMAWIYAKQAEAMVRFDAQTTGQIAKFIEALNFKPQKKITIPYWNDKELKRRQMLFPSVLVMFVVFVLLLSGVKQGLLQVNKTVSDGYYEAVMISGRIVPSDMVESHIIKVDSDGTSREYLVHFKHNCTIYYGPDTRYTPMAEGLEGQTVRITGHTFNKAWLRVVLDNGEIGYVHKSNLEKGMGNPVPSNSQVYRG
ncbi:MAG: DnaJ domain-containing protein [Alphaproteobacteria bacterium]|nr:DnaJ domain-containing protein [Alphaproteobacteria bacterium]